MPTTVTSKSKPTATVKSKSAIKLNGTATHRKPKNRFIGATEDETDQRVFEYNRFLDTLTDEEMDRELEKLSGDELHLLAWTTTYYVYEKRRKEEKKRKKKGKKK